VIPGWLPVAIVLLPLAASVLTALVPRGRPGLAHGLGAGVLALAAGLALWQAITVVVGDLRVQGPHAVWLALPAIDLGVGVFVDPFGAVMALIVCLLAALVVVYNAWYMRGDPLAARFPWQLCFFASAMLGVVLSDNLFLSFVCWELVGLGSYLLIGFWFHKPAASEDPDYQRLKGKDARGVLEDRLSPSHAQLKAFLMNRVGDAGFLLGICLLLAAGAAAGGMREPLTWSNLELQALGGHVPLLAALGVFCGAIGKSAQFPLHPWLPDAMQGPTTASSIIHAATMVAAGVFLVARSSMLFAPDALAVVGWTGGVTCLLAAAIACVQWDLKAVLAYSTVSQLGLMFVGLGAGEATGGQAAGIAHLFTHAWFKCLLFLCAGAVIHAAAGCQDLARLGGLWRRMPVTAATSLLAVLAILGTPLFSGFVSKDAVLAAALAHAQQQGGGAWGPLVLAGAGSLLTAAYMLRWWLSIFVRSPRAPELTAHAHDPSPSAKLVLVAMAPFTLALPWTLGSWLEHALRAPHGEPLHAAHASATWLALGLLLAGAAFSLIVYWRLPARGLDAAAALHLRLRALHAAASELFGIDRLWDRVFTRGLGKGLGNLSARIDLGSLQRLAKLESEGPRRAEILSLDGCVDGIGLFCARLGRAGSSLHAGRLGTYVATAAIAGAGVLLLVLLR
jgi:NADH-quinone oxidoreductase subunit L